MSECMSRSCAYLCRPCWCYKTKNKTGPSPVLMRPLRAPASPSIVIRTHLAQASLPSTSTMGRNGAPSASFRPPAHVRRMDNSMNMGVSVSGYIVSTRDIVDGYRRHVVDNRWSPQTRLLFPPPAGETLSSSVVPPSFS